MIRRIFITGLLLAAGAAALVYDAHEESSLAPAIAVDGDDIYLAFARLDRTLKFGRYTLSPLRGGEAFVQTSQPMTARTNEPFALAVGDKALFLSWVDYRDGKVSLARYSLTSKGEFKHTDTRTTGVSPVGGTSLAYENDRLYLGYTDGEDKVVKVVTYKVSKKGKLSRENERELGECETVKPSALAVDGGTLIVAWVDEDKKFMLTTYAIEKTSKGPSFDHLKETRTEIKVKTQPDDKPALAAADEEVYLAYVDKTDKSAHVNFYTLGAEGALKSGGEARVNERPSHPVGIAVAPSGKVYFALVDRNKKILLAEK